MRALSMCSLSDRSVSLSVYFSLPRRAPPRLTVAAVPCPLPYPLPTLTHCRLNIAKYFQCFKRCKNYEKFRVKIIFVSFSFSLCVWASYINGRGLALHRHLPLYNFECFYTAKLLAYFNETAT